MRAAALSRARTRQCQWLPPGAEWRCDSQFPKIHRVAFLKGLSPGPEADILNADS